MKKETKRGVSLKFTHPILIGVGAVAMLPNLLKGRKSKKVFLLADERLTQARKKTVKILEQSHFEVTEILLTAGEGLKDIESVYPIYGELLKGKADRDSLIIALGGGTVGDVAGFIASTYLRGIDWIGLPTTLLSQVDSSVGGKTGINHAAGKNLIGSFYQPKAVICDVDFLNTLNQREIISGIGEITKCAITFDSKFFAYLEKNLPLLLKRKPDTLQYCIQKALTWKCIAVKKDVYDRTGVREVLNFGHTFGHALESATHYEAFQHGEAVIWGMRFAIALSEARMKLKSKDRLRLDLFLRRLEIPALPKKIDQKVIFPYMKKDKKSEGGLIRFVLIDRLGHSVSDKEVKPEDLEHAYSLMTKSGGPNAR